jgi:hypothetical protein
MLAVAILQQPHTPAVLVVVLALLVLMRLPPKVEMVVQVYVQLLLVNVCFMLVAAVLEVVRQLQIPAWVLLAVAMVL